MVSYGDHAETFSRLVTEDGDQIGLDFTRIGRRARVGERIAVRGVRDADRIEVSDYDVLGARGDDAVRQALRRAPESRTFKVAAISVTTEMSQDALRKRVFTDPDSPAAFYRENSYGAWKLEGDVYGPYAITATGCTIEKLYDIVAEANDAALADGFDPSAYDNLMYFLGERGNNCTFEAAGEVGINEIRGFLNAKYSWYRAVNCVALAQEIGHNFGLLHAHKCTDPPYVTGMYGQGMWCLGFNEYGDNYTPMGGGCGHFNAPEAAALGYIAGCNTLDVTSSGTFEIGPIEAKCSGPQVIRISANAMANFGPQYVFVEYRRGAGSVGSDRVSRQGVYFHASAEYGGNRTGIGSGTRHNVDYALDPYDIHDPLTTAGAAWTEPSSGATFELLALGDTARVGVTIPDVGTGAATCIDGTLPPSSPMCSTITIDAGASDAASEGGEAGPDLDGGGTALEGGNDDVGQRSSATDGSLEVPTDAPSEVGCGCSTPGRSGSHRPLAALLSLAAFLSDRRRRRPLRSTADRDRLRAKN
jgi:MYXO-CTERM domain-containing protein